VTLPRASYRLQLRQGCDLRQAIRRVPYLARLGVSHLYLSPITAARPDSPHGYDGIDPTRLDPALGNERDLASLAATLHRRAMGLLLDFVPNHMAADPHGTAFCDVLTHGPASRFARWFDVEWNQSNDRHDPLLLPWLDVPPSRALRRGDVRMLRCDGDFRLCLPGRRLPVDPATLPLVLRPALDRLPGAAPARAVSAFTRALVELEALPPRRPRNGDARSGAAAETLTRLAALLGTTPALRRGVDAALARLSGAGARTQLARFLAAQPYRLGFWRSARSRLNYRRFFDVNELIALRVEDPAVFSGVHEGILRWIGRGWIDGLRIDHVDGLRDPAGYLRRLRAEVNARLPGRARPGFPIYVEKILASGERLPASWPVDGTTGYEFACQAEAVLIAPAGARALERAWSRHTGRKRCFREVARGGKRRVLVELLEADLRRLTRLARSAAECSGRAPSPGLRRALRELIVHLPVYRTYAGPRGRLTPADRRVLAQAFADARRTARAPAQALATLERLLLGAAASGGPSVELLLRLQQVSGPAAAKGVEDTAFYQHLALASRNEVGSDPAEPLDAAVATLHASARRRWRRHPANLLAVSTHDAKRSADVRARLDVLSEIPDAWRQAVARWRRWNRDLRRRVAGTLAPDPATEWLLYQTLVGVWPLPEPGRPPGALPARRSLVALHERVEAYAQKAMREAKQRTSWIAPQPQVEGAMRVFLRGLFDPHRPFLADLAGFAAGIIHPGLWNALGRTLVQFTTAGVPDLYQGDERFEFTLADPDNRRPVDFAALAALLADTAPASGGRRGAEPRSLMQRPEDGRLKLHVIHRALALRRARPKLFAGVPTPLPGSGTKATHALAFARGSGRHRMIVVVPRLPLTLVGGPAPPIGSEVWGDARLPLPRPLREVRWRCALSRQRLEPAAQLSLGEMLRELPLALLVASGSGDP